MSTQFFLSTVETLFSGNKCWIAVHISEISCGYFLSHVTRSRTARPFGLDKLPSPSATPIMYACVLLLFFKCWRRDLNPQELPRTILSRLRLPISPLQQVSTVISQIASTVKLFTFCISVKMVVLTSDFRLATKDLFPCPHITKTQYSG